MIPFSAAQPIQKLQRIPSQKKSPVPCLFLLGVRAQFLGAGDDLIPGREAARRWMWEEEMISAAGEALNPNNCWKQGTLST